MEEIEQLRLALRLANAQLVENGKEIARLRKMIAKSHHLECGCSFCRSVGFVYGGEK